MGQILLGVGLALAATTVVQLFVTPHVLARTRGREHWERSVLDLAALLEEELPRAIDRYRWAASDVRLLERLLGDETYDQAKVQDALAEATTESRQADSAVGGLMARLQKLTNHARQVNSDATYWTELDDRRRRLRVALFDVDARPRGAPDLDDEAWEKGWGTVDEARQQMLEKVNEIVVPAPLKPPPLSPLRRPRRRITGN